MTTQHLNLISSHIEDIATYAKAINFDAATGNFDELMNGWIKRGLEFSRDVQDNKEDVLRMMKKLVATPGV